MQLHYKIISVCIALCLSVIAVHAQRMRRTCDISPIINAPTDTVVAGETIVLKLSVGNKGPDKMVSGDGFILILSTVRNGQRNVFRSGILGGQGNDTLPFENLLAWEGTFHFPATSITEPTTIDLCAQVFSEAVRENGDSIIMAYYDPDKSNNITCNTITIMPQEATGLKNATVTGTSFSIYPNPAADKLYVEAGGHNGAESVRVIIRDICGQVVQNQIYAGTQIGGGPVVVKIQQLPSGFYTISVQRGNVVSTKKFSISR